MPAVTRKAESLLYDDLLIAAKGLGLRRLEATVLRFPTTASNYAVCAATLEADSGAIYREVATTVAISSSETARARAVESACMKAKMLALETFTGIKGIPAKEELAPAATVPRAAAPVAKRNSPMLAPAPTEPCSECGAPLTYGHREFSMNMFKRPLCVACQINAASSR